MWLTPTHFEELLRRWLKLGESLKCSGKIWEAEGRRLIGSWSRWPRRYHNTSHLFACLRHLESVRMELQHPETAELALWFHDAVYWPWLPRNEEKSAEWATNFMQRMGMGDSMCEEVHQHIMDTRHQAVPTDADSRWIVDIDLAILGQTEAVYKQFERNVRSEYRWVRWSRYVQGRSAVLKSFLDRPEIYNTAWFRERYETSARTNLHHAIDSLSDGKLYV